ncbi:Cytochrome c2 [Faunimonas pinastri]|uniref:Cytochrome c2 n=1 Tax=Faunimonas pinastri TaxID=1855383 RepID=A0A1H9HEU1_9HYPH|nr:cytochrome c family protein [Faunimonas pinastri]SEQ60782.1 Cytochrome c2 [Faunimonas pinastri]
MDTFELNKIAGAVLFTLLIAFGLHSLSDIIFNSPEPAVPGYSIVVAETSGGGAPAPVAEPPIEAILASADPKAGEATAKKCQACHDLSKGGVNKTGPHLYGVVNRPIASIANFQYSDAMKAFAAGGKTWTYDNLYHFIHDPRGDVAGTKMTFAGLPSPQDRANVIAYLRSLSDDPAPLPAPPAQNAAAPAAGAPATASQQQTAAANAPASANGTQSPNTAGQTGSAGGAPGSGSGGDFATLVGQMNPADGQSKARICQTCHSLEKNGPNKIGPHLWGVIGRKVASADGFAYSDAMKKFAAGDKVWSFDELDHFLENPRAHVPGTKMTYAGIPQEADRAKVVAYLRTLADTPVPLPTVDSKPGPAPAANRGPAPAANVAPTQAAPAPAVPAGSGAQGGTAAPAAAPAAGSGGDTSAGPAAGSNNAAAPASGSTDAGNSSASGDSANPAGQGNNLGATNSGGNAGTGTPSMPAPQ